MVAELRSRSKVWDYVGYIIVAGLVLYSLVELLRIGPAAFFQSLKEVVILLGRD